MTDMTRKSSRTLRGKPASFKLSLTVQFASRAQHLPARAQLRRWIKAALQREVSITLRIVDEPEGRELNRAYRGKDYATNVLTFVYDDSESTPNPPQSPLIRGDEHLLFILHCHCFVSRRGWAFRFPALRPEPACSKQFPLFL